MYAIYRCIFSGTCWLIFSIPDKYIYVGCYGDGPGRDLNVLETLTSDMTVENCYAICLSQGTTYFGIQVHGCILKYHFEVLVE